jgi:peptidoglycan/LPS O-acetylase OafA/YrhL
MDRSGTPPVFASRDKPPSAGATRLEAIALLLMAAAWGWNGGNFSQPNLPLAQQILITGLHFVPSALVIGFGAMLLAERGAGWARRAVSVVASLGLVALAIIVPMGLSNPDPNSFGPHNFADYVPVSLILVGVAAWFGSQFHRRSGKAR